MRQLLCLRCRTQMHHVKTEKLQLGQTSLLLGDWPNLMAGALEVAIYACPSCGKLEFFQTEEDQATLPQKCCPRCGRHDGEGIPLSVLKQIKGYIRDSRTSDERSEAHDKIPNIKL